MPTLPLNVRLHCLGMLCGGGALATFSALSFFAQHHHWGFSFNQRLLLAAAIILPFNLWMTQRLTGRLARRLRALERGFQNVKDYDFSISINSEGTDELAQLSRLFNEMGHSLRDERQRLHQRELLLDCVLQHSPLAVLLIDPTRRVILANPEARQLLTDGQRMHGLRLDDVIATQHPELFALIHTEQDGLLSLQQGNEMQTYHVSRGKFTLNSQDHTLYLFKQMTRDINQREAAAWKKVIRVISHELNNSLAPIQSLTNTGKLLLKDQPNPHKLEKIFSVIGERTAHLSQFISAYGRFARLPLPQYGVIEWRTFFEDLRTQITFEIKHLDAISGWGDQTQLIQVMLNLINNALEAESDPQAIAVSLLCQNNHHVIVVKDRGKGMSSEAVNQAFVPFYSTKPEGTGLGLALCRDIIENHHGTLNYRNRSGGGLVVEIRLPLTEN